MRHLFSLPVLAVALAAAGPALARDPIPEDEMIEKLDDPAFQEGLVSMMSGFMTAMMDLPIGQFAAAMDKAIPDDLKKGDGLADIDPDATVGDLAARDNPDFERDMEGKMRKGTAIMGIFASEFGAMLPQFRAMGEKLKRRMEQID